MEKLLERLKRQALKSCALRGHKMGNFGFTIMAGGMGVKGGYTCIKCGRMVQVNTNPAPNEIDIGGEAVALNCDKF